MEINIPAAGGGSSSNASVGATTSTAPISATELGFVDGGGLLQPMTGTVANGPIVNVSASALPTGGATSALQTTGNTSLATIATNTGAATPAGSNIIGKVGIDQTTPGTTNLVALAANQSVNVAQMNGVTTSMGNGVSGTGVQRVAIASDNTAFSVNATLQTGANVIGSLAANQSINNAQINGVTPLMGNGVTGTGSQRVTIASDNTAFSVNAIQSGTWTVQPGNTANTTAWLMKLSGKAQANAPVRNDYTSTSVTTGAYVQLVASTTSATTEIEIFDSSGQTLYLATGAAASEVNQIIIFPGGNGRIPLTIAAGTRVSIKALSATASVGEIDINFYN